MNAYNKAVVLEALQLIHQHLLTIEQVQTEIRTAASLVSFTLQQEITEEDATETAAVMERATTLAAGVYHVPFALLRVNRAARKFAAPRHLAIYLALSAGVTTTDAAAYFGQGHSNAVHARQAVQDRIDTEPAFKAQVQTCLTAMPPAP